MTEFVRSLFRSVGGGEVHATEVDTGVVVVNFTPIQPGHKPPEEYDGKTDSEERDFAFVDPQMPILYGLDPHLSEEALKSLCPGVDLREIVVKRKFGSPQFEAPDLGVEGFGHSLQDVNGKAYWEYNADGRFNPAYVERLRERHEVKIPPVGMWEGYDDLLDSDLNLQDVLLHEKLTRPNKGFVYEVRYDAPDLGTEGIALAHPLDPNRFVKKFSSDRKINPLFRQLRRSQVRWEIRFMTTGF